MGRKAWGPTYQGGVLWKATWGHGRVEEREVNAPIGTAERAIRVFS